MKRSEALASLSRHHHNALVVAQKLDEREVFPLIERVVPTHEPDAVARELESAKHA